MANRCFRIGIGQYYKYKQGKGTFICYKLVTLGRWTTHPIEPKIGRYLKLMSIKDNSNQWTIYYKDLYKWFKQ